MIRIRLAYVLLDKQVKLNELAEKTGIALNNLSVLKTNKARAIRFSTLDAICKALGCTPGDLLEYVPGSNEPREEFADADESEMEEIEKDEALNASLKRAQADAKAKRGRFV